MSLELKKKQYGLILKKEGEDVQERKVKVASAFAVDSDDEDKVDVCGKNRSASSIRVIKEAERMQERALAEDPTIFDYDASYDQIQNVKNEKIAEIKAKDKERKSKYAVDIIKAHKRRELEKQSREERKQQKEREDEGQEFADKDVFVTGAYRKQMEEVQKFREQEQYEAKFNDLTSVEKQEMWQAGFSRTLLSALARDGNEQTKVKPKIEIKEEVEEETTETVKIEQKAVRARNIRRREKSGSESANENEDKDLPNKSIYDSDDEGPAFNPPPTRNTKNFEGDLKPGLNKVVKRPTEEKVLTKAERLRRAFTPTTSDEEEERKRDSEQTNRREDDRGTRHNGNDRDRKGERREKSPESKRAERKERKQDTEECKEKRLERLKEIVKQRNGPKEIEEMKKRYFERRAAGFVTAPM